MSHLSHLRTFLEAYRSGSFSKAAELLGITQPAASQHIQSLETLVGKRLFIRQARGVTATVPSTSPTQVNPSSAVPAPTQY